MAMAMAMAIYGVTNKQRAGTSAQMSRFFACLR